MKKNENFCFGSTLYKPHLLLFIVSLFLSVNLTAQLNTQKIDSLKSLLSSIKEEQKKVEVLNLVAREYINVSPEKGILYANQAVELAKKISFENGLAKSYENLGQVFLVKQDYNQSMNYFNQANSIYKKLKDEKSYWKSIQKIGNLYYEMGDFTQAMEKFLDALKYFESQDDFEGIVIVTNSIGILFHRQNNPEKALEYYHKAEKILEKSQQTATDIYARIQTNIGLSYVAMNQFRKAEKAYFKSIKANETIKDPRIYTVNIGNLAAVYAGLKDYEKAEEFFKEAIQKSEESNNELSTAVNYGDLGSLYIEMANEEKSTLKRKHLLNQAIANLQIAMKTMKKINNLRRYQDLAKYLSLAYELKNDYKKSLEIYKEHTFYKDSIFNEENNNELVRREIGYEFSKREDSIRLVSEKEIAVRDATLKANKKQKWLLFGGIFLLSIIGGLLFYQNRVRQKHNRKLEKLNAELDEANRTKARFFSILNHDLRSPISNVIKFVRLQQNSTMQLDETTQERLAQQTVKSAENLLNSMEDLLLWSKAQMQNFEPQIRKVDIAEIFEDMNVFFGNLNSIEILFENPENLSVNTDENYLKTITRNLTSNAIKALSETTDAQIIWKAYRENNQTIMAISDNGPGGTDEQFRALYDEKHIVGIKTGLGLHLVRDMAKAINCTVKVNSELDKGTTIRLYFSD